ncbi:uncharacterized protein F4822DRAFT_431896 [Hypoxylon trugodes]|uniref:uncharacterized protein n=1 Tax=Hypoxylon trugodes TaxID=326681 RepID=UPI00219E7541|nr:uncharacterized protein F4822DRAFT_431896 [Hypoxylon trugodes]KAI1387028.1 hypothetical protein F4822DRAFT_431896 [Hypoxylon trugodes]
MTIVHMVFFRFRPEVTQEHKDTFVRELKKLKNLPCVKDNRLIVGGPSITDPIERSKGFEFALVSYHHDRAALDAYQASKEHTWVTQTYLFPFKEDLCRFDFEVDPEDEYMDSHIHIIDPDRFPLDPDRDYTPKPATVDNCTEFQESRGIKHAVVVLPSVYGTNNSVLLDALRHFQGQYRGVAVVDTENITTAELDELHEAGVRGLRVNLGSSNDTDKIIREVESNIAIARTRNWAVQLWVPLSSMVSLHPVILNNSDITFVADHFAHTETSSKTNVSSSTYDPYRSTGFHEVIDLVQRKLLFIKISAPYQNSKQDPLYEDMRIIAQTLIAAGPEMVVYGSDWPHTASKEGNGPGGPLVPSDYRVVNDAALVEIAKDWAGGEAQVQRLFVDNPRRLWQWYSED